MTPAVLAEFPLLLNPKGVPFRDSLDRDLATHGIKLSPKAEVDGMRLLASLATDGFGRQFCPPPLHKVLGNGKEFRWKASHAA
ncbi:MAG: hypothetical protein CM15mP49_03730 [Actinomycetota bacterium]|nr:MAG: hypothetical protein CM15mP49_03730 [Actinomycetota bacterium]